jgi:hypothetical protein
MMLAIYACVRLHNWMMNMEQLPYSADESPEMMFQQYYN